MVSPDTERRPSLISPLLVLSLLLLSAVLLWREAAGMLFPSALHDPEAVPRAITPRGDLAQDEQTTIELFRNASPSVAHITTLEARYSRFSMNAMYSPQGTGTGFAWDDEGYIVTNFHVIQNADRALVVLEDQSEYEARLVGYSANFDLAVLKIDVPKGKLKPILIGESQNLSVGQKVFAIGNPFGLDHTLTTGVISGLDREIVSVTRQPIHGVIQTDAAINPGNSGGPLLDSAGRLIGVNTAIKSPSGANAGIGFAVPVNTVNRIVPELIRAGRAEVERRDGRAALGIRMASDSFARFLGVEGVVVREVFPDTAAQSAGLRSIKRTGSGEYRADAIVELGGQRIREQADLLDFLDKCKVGEKIEMKVRRGQSELVMDVTLQEFSAYSLGPN